MPAPFRPSDMLRLSARLVPAAVRVVLALSAQGYLPARIYQSGTSQALAPELFGNGMPLYGGPVRLYVPLQTFRVFRRFEPLTTECFRSALSKGMTIIDVGANVGYYTVLAARVVGPTGIVHAIEPSGENRSFLERNARLSRLRNIRIHGCAAGATRRRRAFQITENSLDHGFYSHPLVKTVRETMIDEVPLDDLVSAPVHVVKIDVEGAELDVLNGMTRILRENEHISLFLEWNPWCMQHAGWDAKELPQRLNELGLRRLRIFDDLAREECSIEDVLRALREEPTNVRYWMIHASR